MGELVAGFGVPHTPMFPTMVAGDPNCETAQLFDAIAKEVDEVDPDVLLIFDSDHLNTFFLDRYPTLAVGMGSHTSGPNDGTPGLPSYTVPVSDATAQHVYEFGIERDFDFSATHEFEVDHTILVPLHFLRPRMDTPIVPLYINGIVPPLPGARRCHALGKMVAAAIEGMPSDTRVAVMASGGFSLDIGGHRAPPGELFGVADKDWVARMHKLLREGKVDDLLDEATAEQIARAGNVAGELLNWFALLGAVGDRKPHLLEPQMDFGHSYGSWRWDVA